MIGKPIALFDTVTNTRTKSCLLIPEFSVNDRSRYRFKIQCSRVQDIASNNSSFSLETVAFMYRFHIKSHSLSSPCLMAVQYTIERIFDGILWDSRWQRKKKTITNCVYVRIESKHQKVEKKRIYIFSLSGSVAFIQRLKRATLLIVQSE